MCRITSNPMARYRNFFVLSSVRACQDKLLSRAEKFFTMTKRDNSGLSTDTRNLDFPNLLMFYKTSPIGMRMLPCSLSLAVALFSAKHSRWRIVKFGLI